MDNMSGGYDFDVAHSRIIKIQQATSLKHIHQSAKLLVSTPNHVASPSHQSLSFKNTIIQTSISSLHILNNHLIHNTKISHPFLRSEKIQIKFSD